MKINMNVEVIERDGVEALLVNDRWEIDEGGAVWDRQHKKEIPAWIFEIRDFCLKHQKKMNRSLSW